MHRSPLELQAKPNFLYTFKNIILLYEALTHSYDSSNSLRLLANGNVKYKKKTFYRLKTLGRSVLKLVLTEQALCQNETTADPGKLGKKRDALLDWELFTSIGKELELQDFIEIQTGFPRGSIEYLYPNVIKAILGAVYVDSGCNNTSLSVVRGLMAGLHKEWESKLLKNYFPRNKVGVASYLVSKGYVQRNKLHNPELLLRAIGYQFETRSYLVEALTHASCKQFAGLEDTRDYQRLEFLGDAVYELIICDYLFWYYVNDDVGNRFNPIELVKYTSEPFQKVLAKHLSLSDYLLKPSQVEVERIHEFIESLIGAVYLDSNDPLTVTKRILIDLCNACSITLLLAGCEKLPYSMMTYCSSFDRTAFLELSSTQQNELGPLPKIDHKHDIRDPEAFINDWRFFTDSQTNHFIFYLEALNSYKNYTTLHMSAAAANQAEYKRTNLYGTALETSMELMLANDRDQQVSPTMKNRKDDEVSVQNSKITPESTFPGNQKETRVILKARKTKQVKKVEEEEMIRQSEKDHWVTVEEASKAVICLWSFFVGWCWFLFQWVVHSGRLMK